MRKNRELQRKTSGFTLVEMIVTLLVLAIVAAISVPALLGFIDEGHAKQCEANKKALAEEIVSARMAYEVNGKNAEEGKTGKEFDEDKVIASSNLKCPTKGEYTYDPTTDEIVCEEHGRLKLPNSGKYDVSVKDVSQTEAKASSEPLKPSGESTPGTSEDASSPTPSEEPTPGTSEDTPSPTPSEEPTPGTSGNTPSPTPGEVSGPTSPKEHSYTVEIEGSLNMETGETGELHVVVKDENGKEVPPERVKKVEWKSPQDGCASVEADGSVRAEKEGRGKVSCTVTIEEEDGSEKTVQGNPADITVTAPNLHIELTLNPPSLILQEEEMKNLTAITAVKNEKGKIYTEKSVTLEWQNDDETVASVKTDDQNRTTAQVTGVKPGNSTITVTARAEGGLSATATATVEVTKKGSLLKPGYDPLLIEQTHVAETINNIKEEYLNRCVAEGMEGGTWTGTSNGLDVLNYNLNTLQHDPTHQHDDLVLTYTYNGKSESIRARVVHPMERIQLLEKEYTLKIGDVQNLTIQSFSPEFSTDKITNWIIEDSGSECITLLSSERTAAKIEAISPGTVYVRVEIPRIRGTFVPADSPDRLPLVEKIKVTVTDEISPNPGITGVTLNPSPMTLKVGESKQITAELQTNKTIDMSKVTYSIYSWSLGGNIETIQDSQKDNWATVKGSQAGKAHIEVAVSYDGSPIITGSCDVTVEEAPLPELPKDRTLIDGNYFSAQSWEDFKAAVKALGNQSYKVNNNPGTDNASETLFFYDEAEDGTRTYYMMTGKAVDFKYEDKHMENYQSFEAYIKAGYGESIIPIDLEQEIVKVREDQLKTAPDEAYPNGTIVRVEKSTGEYEYYLAYNAGNAEDGSGKRTQLSSIKKPQSDMKNNGWWKLKIQNG